MKRRSAEHSFSKSQSEGFDKNLIVLFFDSKEKQKTANENKGLKIKHKDIILFSRLQE